MDLATIFSFWWIPTVLILFWLFWKLWMYYINNTYASSLEWTLLEIRIPERVKVTPKAMEQVVSGLHGAYKGGNLIDRYIQGYLPHYFSLEIVGINGEIHFFIRTQARFRNLVEGQVYAQYPDAEIIQAEDYTKNVPKEIPSKDWNCWGSEVIFTNKKFFPIRTYPHFKEEETEEGIIDPLASLAEIMSRLNQGEQLWVQILISATHEPWQKDGRELVDELIGSPAKPKKKDIFDRIESGLGKIVEMPEKAGILRTTDPAPKKDDKGVPSQIQFMPPGATKTVESVEAKIAKLGFNSKIRFVYLGRRDVFDMGNVAAFFGALKQFAGQDINGFKPDPKTACSIDYLFKRFRSNYRRRKVITKYRWRSISGAQLILNTEETASIYHFPGLYVKAPQMPRIEAKKGTPPVGLPVE